MIDLRGFRKTNNLTQDELGEYLGMKKSFISKVENGREKLPAVKLQKLLSNDKGWDTSMLVDEMRIDLRNFGDFNIHQSGGIGKVGAGSPAIASMQKEIEMLKAQIEELKAEKAAYWETIQSLIKK